VIIKTIQTQTPKQTALYFQGVLAADRGYTSTLIPQDNGDFIVQASDGLAVRFSRTAR